MILSKLVHQTLNQLYSSSDQKFIRGLQRCESTQSECLKDSIAGSTSSGFWKPSTLENISSYREFTNKVPVTNYSTYSATIHEQMKTPNKTGRRWEPTSGSTQKRKWIPYDQRFLNQLHRGSYPWLKDVYRQYPKVLGGTHYWSLSWLPQDLRGQTNTDDSELFPWWQRIFLKNIFPVPSRLARIDSQEAFWHATLAFLASQENLRLISVWSPTLLNQVLESLQSNWDPVLRTLESGQWQLFQESLSILPAPRRSRLPKHFDINSASELWPHLSLISCWDSSTSKSFADELKPHFPNVPLQGKGLWATEGVVTIPYQSQHPLAIRSHFYEFRDLESQRLFLPHQLKPGMKVQPLISTSNGFLRYELDDVLEVKSFLAETPCFEFQGRRRGVDMVGEKMDAFLAQNILEDLRRKFSGQFYALKASLHPKPNYKLVCVAPEDRLPQIAQCFEDGLLEIHHYRLARDLGQMAHSEVLNLPNSTRALEALHSSSVAGQNKIESLILEASVVD